jgi:hypothetical protein
MKFIQYIDPIIKGELSKIGIHGFEFEFESMEEMLNNPHIQFFTNDKNFNRLLICRSSGNEIISELKDGREYKIGDIDGDIPEMLEWEYKERETE